eukprot:SAG22_NODE_2022_length_3123_cov_12.497354_3_plen_128_part_00
MEGGDSGFRAHDAQPGGVVPCGRSPLLCRSASTMPLAMRDHFLLYTARGLAGHTEDKAWAIGQGERNCGKGVQPSTDLTLTKFEPTAIVKLNLGCRSHPTDPFNTNQFPALKTRVDKCASCIDTCIK